MNVMFQPHRHNKHVEAYENKKVQSIASVEENGNLRHSLIKKVLLEKTNE